MHTINKKSIIDFNMIFDSENLASIEYVVFAFNSQRTSVYWLLNRAGRYK